MLVKKIVIYIRSSIGGFRRQIIKVKDYPKACMTYKLIKKKFGDTEKNVLIITSKPLGDLIYGLAYIDAYKLQNPKKKIIVIADESKREIIDGYQIDKVVYLNSNSIEYKSIQLMNQYKRLAEKGFGDNIIFTVPWVIKPQKVKNETWEDLYVLRNKLYRVRNDAKITYPKIAKVSIQSILNFNEIKKKVVIINQYSNSMDVSNSKIFIEIANLLKDKGYHVFSNVIGTQTPVAGTIPLNCSICELYNIVNEIPLVISVRSGIIDLLISCKSNFFVLYSSDNFRFATDWQKDHTLSAWNTGNVKEVVSNDDATILKEFNKYIENLKDMGENL